MGLGAIVVGEVGRGGFGSTAAQAEYDSLFAEPPAWAHVLGRSTVERTVEQLARADVDVISVLLPAPVSYDVPDLSRAGGNVQVQAVSDMPTAIAQKARQYWEAGIVHSFVVSGAVYSEADLLDFFYFHREAKQRLTRARDHEGFLDMWVFDCARACRSDLDSIQPQSEAQGASYFVGGYVRRLGHPQDLRRLVSDSLSGHCAMRPAGPAVKPGIWIEEGAEVDRRARIVAPAYIGRGTKVCEDALITRCTSIEEHCYVDCGTVVEDSSILRNTHIGIWLDVCHGVANGNKMWSLEHDVLLEISDPSIMRSNRPFRKEAKQGVQQWQTAEELQEQEEKAPAAETWRFGANPIQG